MNEYNLIQRHSLSSVVFVFAGGELIRVAFGRQLAIQWLIKETLCSASSFRPTIPLGFAENSAAVFLLQFWLKG